MTSALGLVASWTVGQLDLADPRILIAGIVLALIGGITLGWYASKHAEETRRQAQEAYESEVIKAAGHARARARKEKQALEELVARTQEEHSRCGARIVELEKQLRDRGAAVDGLEAELASERRKRTDDKAGIDRMKERIRELEAQARKARGEVENAREEISRLREQEEQAARDATPVELLTAVDGAQDDLQAIRGLGPILEQRLNELGIRQYRQLARITSDNAEWVATRINILPSRILREKWARQARQLHQRKYSDRP